MRSSLRAVREETHSSHRDEAIARGNTLSRESTRHKQPLPRRSLVTSGHHAEDFACSLPSHLFDKCDLGYFSTCWSLPGDISLPWASGSTSYQAFPDWACHSPAPEQNLPATLFIFGLLVTIIPPSPHTELLNTLTLCLGRFALLWVTS